MANTYDLTQTGSEVQAILNDANNIKGAGAQTTLTTDYILLKDTNGQYHKILKDSFTEACRNVLAGLLVNNDKGTTISQIAAIASGDFGSVTPANLASVLGVDSEIMYNVYNDLNDVITPCRMLLLPGSQTYTNTPSQFTGNTTEGVLVVFPFTTNVSNPRIGQFILSNIGFFLRFKSSGGWSTWIKVSNA